MRNKVGKIGKQNRRAGNHPSYRKRNMSLAQILAKRAYDKRYAATDQAKKYRAELGKKKPAGNGKNNAHTENGDKTFVQSESKNKANNRPKVRQTKASDMYDKKSSRKNARKLAKQTKKQNKKNKKNSGGSMNLPKY